MANLFVEIVCYYRSTISSDNKKEFNLMANLIVSFYNEHIKRIRIKGLRKIRIDLSTNKEDSHFMPYFTGQPVCSLVNSYNFDNYFNKSTTIEKRHEILMQIRINVDIVCDKLNLDKEPFENAYKLVLARLSEDLLLEKKINIIESKDKKFKAGIKVVLQTESLSLSVFFYNTNGDFEKEIEVIKILPNFYFLKLLLGQFTWLNEHEVQISNETSEIIFTISHSTGKVDVSINPNESSEDKLISLLDKIKYKPFPTNANLNSRLGVE